MANDRETEIAARLLAEAREIDPGLRAASLAPHGSAQRLRHERIRDHYIAYGVRWALDELGLLPDADDTPR